MEYIGLIFEFLFLAAGVYGYLFAIGKINSKDPKMKKKADEFRKQNGTWIRYGSLLIMALMVVNIYLHLKDLMS